MKGVKCYELFGGIALKKSHIFIFFSLVTDLHMYSNVSIDGFKLLRCDRIVYNLERAKEVVSASKSMKSCAIQTV